MSMWEKRSIRGYSWPEFELERPLEWMSAAAGKWKQWSFGRAATNEFCGSEVSSALAGKLMDTKVVWWKNI